MLVFSSVFSVHCWFSVLRLGFQSWISMLSVEDIVYGWQELEDGGGMQSKATARTADQDRYRRGDYIKDEIRSKAGFQ